MSLFWRVVLINAAVLVAAVMALVLSPASVSASPTAAEIQVLIVGTVLVIALNVLLLRRVFVPLERLTGTMRRVDPLEPGRRVALRKPAAEVADVQEAARAGVEHVRGIARGLRPGALEELGLRSALTTLATTFGGRTGLRVRHAIATDLPLLSAEQDLAVYRVAQESLTNVVRHAGAHSAELKLAEEDDAVVLRVTDDGGGIPAVHAAATDGGVGGMRERALLAGGRLRVGALPGRGTEVTLELWPSR